MYPHQIIHVKNHYVRGSNTKSDNTSTPLLHYWILRLCWKAFLQRLCLTVYTYNNLVTIQSMFFQTLKQNIKMKSKNKKKESFKMQFSLSLCCPKWHMGWKGLENDAKESCASCNVWPVSKPYPWLQKSKEFCLWIPKRHLRRFIQHTVLLFKIWQAKKCIWSERQ